MEEDKPVNSSVESTSKTTRPESMPGIKRKINKGLTATGKITKAKNKGIVKATKNTGTRKNDSDTGTRNKKNDVETGDKNIDMETVDKNIDMETVDKNIDMETVDKNNDMETGDKNNDIETTKIKDTGKTKRVKVAGTAKKVKDAGPAKKIKDTETVKKVKVAGTAKKVKDTETAKKVKDTETAKKVKGTGTAKKFKDTETAKKVKGTGTTKNAEDDAGKLNTIAGPSRMKVPKKKPIAENKIQKIDLANKKITLIEEVYEAIAITGQPRKGATSQSIKNYIFSKHEAEKGDRLLNIRINKALRKAMEDGTLERPTTWKENVPMVSASGRFILSKKGIKPEISKQLKVMKAESSKSME